MSTQTNMTKGNPTKLLLNFAIPLMLGTIFQQSFILVDRIIVGHLIGANAFSSVGATGSISMVCKRLIFRYDKKIPDYFSVAGAP